MMRNWGWPQWYFAIIMALQCLCVAWLHGKDRTGKHNGFAVWINVAIGALALLEAGFWSGACNQ